ncbi:MAG: prepilin-type N-terminal cleavage/methylation domain-containing protein [Acidobacteriota bacterium]
MKLSSAQGFSLIELMIATAVLLVVMSTALSFFSRSQVVYTNERVTLDMVQDMRTVFDRFTNEIRMAGSGLPAPRGVIEGSPTTLIVRGDFNNIATIITSVSPITVSGSTATFPVGTTAGFAEGQTISLINNLTGVSALARITAVDATAKAISVDKDDLFPIESGAQLTDNPGTNSFPAGAIINVIERRTYSIITAGDDKGAITRTVIYENTQTAGTTIQSAEIIARNVLDENGNPGLTFTYYKPDGTSAGLDVDGNVIPSEAVKVQINLLARSVNPDLQTGKYRTFAYTALVQVRGQYVPRVGF